MEKNITLTKEERDIIKDLLQARRYECDGFGRDDEEEELKIKLTNIINKL